MIRFAEYAPDLLRAFGQLRPENEQTQWAIADLLGAERMDTSFQKEPERKDRLKPDIEPDLSRPFTDSGGSGGSQSSRSIKGIPSTLTPPVSAPKGGVPVWLNKVSSLPPPSTSPIPELPEPEPLFLPLWTRSILTAALAVMTEESPVDHYALVRTISQGKVVSRVPRLNLPMMAGNVQLLVDRSDGMMPFLADIDGIVQRCHDVTSDDRLSVLRFSGCPLRNAGKGPRHTWSTYIRDHTPPPATRVVCITDLGIGYSPGGDFPASPSEWLAFAHHLRCAGCSLLALVPYSPSRWPEALKRKIPIVHWDSATGVGQVARLIQRFYWRRWVLHDGY